MIAECRTERGAIQHAIGITQFGRAGSDEVQMVLAFRQHDRNGAKIGVGGLLAEQ